MRSGFGEIAALGALLCLAAPVGASDEEPALAIAVVVGPGWTGPEEIDLPTLRSLYLGRRTEIAGQRVIPLQLPAGSAARRIFSRGALGASDAVLERYWLEQALLGGPMPPRELANAERMRAVVSTRRGALGYLPADELEPEADAARGLRVLAIRSEGRDLRPTDPDYPLRSTPED